MIMMLGVGVEGGFQAAQTAGSLKLRKDQHRQMVPALERLAIGVPVVPLHDRAELPPFDGFEQPCKDAIDELHARPFLSLDNRKGSVCADSAEHAPRHGESFPGHPCPRGERVGVRGSLRESLTFEFAEAPLTPTLSPRRAGRGSAETI